MSATIFSNTNNQSVISSLLVHRIESGVKPSASDMSRLRQARDMSSSRSSSKGAADERSPRDGHPPPTMGSAQPPPSCPMHSSGAPSSSSSSSKAPMTFASVSGKGSAMGGAFSSSDSGCPVPHDQRESLLKEGSSGQQGLNPLNNMPNLSQSVISALQKANLSTERTVSSIPRSPVSAAPGASPYDAPASCPVAHDAKGKGKAEEAEQADKWEYPSPQQFYNALVRKGWETPEENVEMMVLIHNFLNERAWQEVIEWEKLAGTDVSHLQLAKFQGRPGTLSPKARLQGYLALLMPNKYSSEPPFDRHDWIVQRPTGGKSEDELKPGQIRYIIDYYEAPGENPEEDEAVFNLDVRPALDSFEALRLRARKTFQEWGSSEQSQQAQTQAHKS